MMPLPRSLQGRLLALVLGLVVVIWLGMAAMTWFDARHELDELLDSHLAQAAALLVVQQSLEFEDDDHMLEVPALHRYAPKVAFQVFHEGRLVLRSPNAPTVPMDGSGAPSKTGFTTVQIDGSAWRVFAAQGAKRDVRVYVGEEVASRASILWALMRSMFWSMFIALPVLALAAWWAVYSGVAPLRRLGRMLADRQPHALDPVMLPDAPAEMAPMLDALNGLFERIARLVEAERRFTADAAHELRTPIAAIRAQAQVALGEADDARRRHALQSTLAGCDRAARLVDQMLTLSRLESGIAPMAATVYIGAVVRQVVAELAPQALHKRQSIEVDAIDACAVTGDATLLALLVRNLVDNAIRYSPPGAKVRVAVVDGDARVRLLVEDSGPGMSTQDMQRFGERFFRVAGSGQSGSGLGASIVMRIAQAHRAAVGVSVSNMGGLAVTVTWPPG